MNPILLWTISAAAIAGVLFRPRHWPEAVWACLGALLLVLGGALPPAQAGAAAAKGTDVYLFLTGMMLLAELARREGVFDWLATHAVIVAQGSAARLFALIYAVGIAVTVLLSNDATAVVLTPAVYAAVKKARAEPLPYLLICAFIANAASFVLPISNPANLIVYASHLPPLLRWLRMYFAPSLVSIAVTYLALRWLCRSHLNETVQDGAAPDVLSPEGRRAFAGILASGAVLVAASAFDYSLGLPTCAAAIVSVLIATRARPRAVAEIAAGVSWSVLPLVAGLFILVEAWNRAGAQIQIGRALLAVSHWSGAAGPLAASFGVAALSNLINNLPSGLLAGGAVNSVPATAAVRDAVLIGIDLGPNLSVTGSLATILWLIALRREDQHISGWRFLKYGAVVMPPALLAATAAIWLMNR